MGRKNLYVGRSVKGEGFSVYERISWHNRKELSANLGSEEAITLMNDLKLGYTIPQPVETVTPEVKLDTPSLFEQEKERPSATQGLKRESVRVFEACKKLEGDMTDPASVELLRAVGSLAWELSLVAESLAKLANEK